MHCLLKSLSGGFAPPAALANFRSVFHSGFSLFKQLLFLHFELEFAPFSSNLSLPSPKIIAIFANENLMIKNR
jgi:hypothetical protein